MSTYYVLAEDTMEYMKDSSCFHGAYMSVGKMNSNQENKIISDSDMCYEDSTEDHGSVLQPRWYSVADTEKASLKR